MRTLLGVLGALAAGVMLTSLLSSALQSRVQSRVPESRKLAAIHFDPFGQFVHQKRSQGTSQFQGVPAGKGDAE